MEYVKFADLPHKKNKKNTRIDWNYCADHIKLTQSEWNEKVAELQSNELYTEDVRNFYGYKTNLSFWHFGTYRFEEAERQHRIYMRELNGSFVVYITNNDDEKNDSEGSSGPKAFKIVNDMFKEQYGICLVEAFGKMPRGEKDRDVGSDTLYHYQLEHCVEAVPAIIRFNPIYSGRLMGNIYKADVSSAYPYQLTFALPDATTAITYPGKIRPQPDEVAFWTKSGHIIEGRDGGVDTTKLINHPLYRDRHKFIETFDDETVIMKYSKYSLSDTMHKLYDQRHDDPLAKETMVKFIGMLMSRKQFQSCYMGHISAIVYARHIKAMCGYYDALIKEKRLPIMYATDSIIWCGGPSSITQNEKELGTFHLEYANAKAIMYACGVYAIEDERGLSTVKHQGIAKAKVENKPLRNLEDFRNLIEELGIQTTYYDQQTHTFKYENNKLLGVL